MKSAKNLSKQSSDQNKPEIKTKFDEFFALFFVNFDIFVEMKGECKQNFTNCSEKLRNLF